MTLTLTVDPGWTEYYFTSPRLSIRGDTYYPYFNSRSLLWILHCLPRLRHSWATTHNSSMLIVKCFSSAVLPWSFLLGPLLFLIYINGSCNCVSSIGMVPDECAICRMVTNNYGASTLQSNINEYFPGVSYGYLKLTRKNVSTWKFPVIVTDVLFTG